MKKIFLSLLLLLVTASTFSQRIIDKPDYGMSNIPGSITKIELNLDATIVHFHLEMPEGNSFSVPNKSFIQDTKGGEKLFVTKAEGVPLNKKYNLPESGQIDYQLYFSPLPATVNTIDFGEANQGGNWSVYDIVINEEQEQFLLPKELQGNWFLTDGSNQWDYGFYKSKAIVDMAVWDYKTVEKSKGSYAIVLESNGKQKTIYAQIDKKGTSLGNDKKQLKLYSTTKIEKPNYKLANDKMFSNIIFKTDSTTYSGVVKGYSKRANIKTGAIHVNNVLTGNQDNYVVKIAPDGSFSVKFAIDYPQSIYVRLANFNSDVYVEPGKVTFQLIDGKNNLFMGDCARVNTDLKSLKTKSYLEFGKLRKTILETNPEEYKKACLTIKNKEIEKLNQTIKKQFIGQKAVQIKKMDIEYNTFFEILLYEMHRERLMTKDNAKDSKSIQNLKLEASYYDFITPSILNDSLAVMGINYSSFVNLLKYASILRTKFSGITNNSISETAALLQKSGIVLSKDEVEMISESTNLDKIRLKYTVFHNTNQSKIKTFFDSHKEDYVKFKKENPRLKLSVTDFATSLKAQGIVLSTEENELVQLHKLSLPTKEEEEQEVKFTTKYGQILKEFYKKYQTNIQEITSEKDFIKSKDKYKEVFGLNQSFVFDIFTLQNKLQELENNSIPFSDNQLKRIQSEIRHPFLSNYIVLENDRLKSKIESNKTKTGFTVNAVKKTEGDELFESMIAKFKGKVIYVDFWATWCSPCMIGIKKIAPLKEEMKNDNVVFLYITNQTSPENTWNVKIPDIKGEHYRVSEDEWNYLSQKFNISGIPHYVLVNKKGEIVNRRLGHFGNEQLKSILEKEIEKF